MDQRLIQLTYQDKTITLVPVAHVSADSRQLVEDTIAECQPDCICVELDEDRCRSLTHPGTYRTTSVTQIIKEKKVGFMLVNVILGNYQRKMAEKLGSGRSGGEMLAGVQAAQRLGVPLVLADRRIQTTFQRIWASLNLWDRLKMIWLLISALLSDEDISEEDLARLQQSDLLAESLKEVSRSFPKVARVLVDERDQYLTAKIRSAPGKNIVAVLGAAHVPGVQRHLNDDIDTDALDAIPPKPLTSKIAGWIIPAIIIGLIIASFIRNWDMGLAQLKRWILINGTLSAAGALLAGAHPLSIVTAFAAAPVSSLSPLLAAGWFAGLVEAHFRKPTVQDFDEINQDLNSWKGLWKNKVTRILLVVVFANLGSTLGTILGGLDIVKNLF